MMNSNYDFSVFFEYQEKSNINYQPNTSYGSEELVLQFATELQGTKIKSKAAKDLFCKYIPKGALISDLYLTSAYLNDESICEEIIILLFPDNNETNYAMRYVLKNALSLYFKDYVYALSVGRKSIDFLSKIHSDALCDYEAYVSEIMTALNMQYYVLIRRINTELSKKHYAPEIIFALSGLSNILMRARECWDDLFWHMEQIRKSLIHQNQEKTR